MDANPKQTLQEIITNQNIDDCEDGEERASAILKKINELLEEMTDLKFVVDKSWLDMFDSDEARFGLIAGFLYSVKNILTDKFPLDE